MSLRIGRIVGLPEPISWATTGDRLVTIVGSYKATSVADGLVRRDQILAYAGAGADEAAIPVMMNGEPRINGYYRVLGAAFTTDMFTRAQGNLYDYRIDLEGVAGVTQPAMESVISGALLTNVVGAVAGDVMHFHAVPAASVEYMRGSGGSFFTRTCADGDLLFYTGGYIGTTAHFYLAPASAYLGAALIEQGSGGLPGLLWGTGRVWGTGLIYGTGVVGMARYPVIGRQLTQPDTTNWRLSNGLVRITPSATSPGQLDISHWAAGAWSTAKTYVISGTVTAGAINGFTTLTVLRNSPEECIIRLGCKVAYGIGWSRVTLDISLRRGDRIVRIYLSADDQDQYKVARATAEAATAITYGAVTAGGMRATANDGNGNRYVLLSYQAATTSDLVNGALTLTSTLNSMDIGIGSEVGGSGAVIPDRAVDIAQQYLAAQSESQRVVAR